MSHRRFSDHRESTSSRSRESELAHENLLAVNADLRRQVTALEQSMSFRVGRLILGLLQPVFTLLRIKRFANRPPSVVIDSSWPRLSGSITVFQHSRTLIPVRVTNASEELLNESIDPAHFVTEGVPGPWTGTFEFRYPLGFRSFDASELTARVGNADLRLEKGAESAGARILRPIEIAVDSTIAVHGDLGLLRSEVASRGSVAILSTFRGTDRLTAIPHRLIGALRDEGFAVIVVDTSTELPSSKIECDLLIHRRNIGWDFASWMSTLASHPWILTDAQNLLLVNDSNVGPVRPLRETLRRGREIDTDIWGLTDSWDIAHHLQSYFLHFNASALRSGHLGAFVDAFSFPTGKERIIGSGEIGLSQFMRARGLRLQALFPYTVLARSFVDSFSERVQRVLGLPEHRLEAGHLPLESNDEWNFLHDTIERIRSSAPVNPTHYFWDILLSMGSPFIKRDLLVKNPDLVAGLHRLPDLLPDAAARTVLEEEISTWSRTHADMSLPLALHWPPPSN